MLAALSPIKDSQYNLGKEGEGHCNICYENPGFPTLCNAGDPGEHRFCMECIVEQYKHETYRKKFSCSVCRLRFNFQDYLVVSELHLLQASKSQFILNYFCQMQSDVSRYSGEQYLEDFLTSEEKDQKRVISVLYWGNDSLFDGVDDYFSEKGKRIKENLLEMLGNLWSPNIGAKEKNKQLRQIFENGRAIRYCPKESRETFLHRCHLFLRAFVPLYVNPRTNAYYQKQKLRQFALRYFDLSDILYLYLPTNERPATGPLDIELAHSAPDRSFLEWKHQYKQYLNLNGISW